MIQQLLLPTMLFVPGSDQRKLDKIPALPAAAFILDLEDAVATAVKPEARGRVASCIRTHGSSRQLFVRVNSLESDLLYEDLEAVTVPGLAGIDLPKVSSARGVQIVDWLLDRFEKRQGMPPQSTAIMATIETVQGLANLDDIAIASPRLRYLCFGAGDFSLDIGVDWPPQDGRLGQTILYAKTQLVVTARKLGLPPPHDGVFPDFRDLAGLRAEAEQSHSLGMFGKHAIHPDQLAVIRQVFTPGERQLVRAREIVDAFERSEREGIAAIHIDGRFVDYPVAERARQVLELAKETQGKE